MHNEKKCDMPFAINDEYFLEKSHFLLFYWNHATMEIKSPVHDTPSVTVALIGDRTRRILAEGNKSIDFI